MPQHCPKDTKIAELEAKQELLHEAHTELMARLKRVRMEMEFHKDSVFVDEYQQWVEGKTSKDYNQRDHALLGIMSETGEIADAVKKAEVYGREIDPEDGGIYEEVGDLMFYVAMLCTSQGFRVSDALRHNISKLNKRYDGGFTKEEAVERKDKG